MYSHAPVTIYQQQATQHMNSLLLINDILIKSRLIIRLFPEIQIKQTYSIYFYCNMLLQIYWNVILIYSSILQTVKKHIYKYFYRTNNYISEIL